MISLVSHQEIVRLIKELSKFEKESEPFSRLLQGFLALPPSKELVKSNQELDLLKRQVAELISSLNV